MKSQASEVKNNPAGIMDSITIRKRFFYLQARYFIEYIYDSDVTKELLNTLVERGADLFTFVERTFLGTKQTYPFFCENETISLLRITSFDDWWKSQIRKDERNLIRKAEKKGVTVKLAEIDEDFFKSSQRIYNETPVRQGRRYTGYGLSLTEVREKFSNLNDSEVLGAYYGDELIGLLWLAHGDSVVRIRSFVSLIKHRDKAPNNALLAEGIKRYCEKGFKFIVYERMGYLPSLDSFKFHNGFRGFVLPRYYVPLTKKGALALKLRVHRDIQHSLPLGMSRALLPVYSLASQTMPASIWRHLSG